MMTENYLLKLLVYQGRDWKLSEGATVYIRASLGKDAAETSPTNYTCPSPKFNAELCWEVDRKTLRGLKLNRLPVKVEFIADNQNCQKILGYVILPLSLAAEKIEVHTQWYKLLGGKLGSHKESPNVLMALSLTDADLVEKEQSSEEEGELDTEDSENEDTQGHINGYSLSPQDNVDPAIQNGHIYKMDQSCELEDEENAMDASYDSCDAEELYNDLDEEAEDNMHEEISDGEESFRSEETIPHLEDDECIDFAKESSSEEKKSQASKMKEVLNKDDQKKEMSDSCKLLASRSDVRNQLRRLSKEHSLSQIGNSSHIKEDFDVAPEPKNSLDISDISQQTNKRTMEYSDIITSTAKFRRLEPSVSKGETSFSAGIIDSISRASLSNVDSLYNKIPNSTSQLNISTGILKNPSDSFLKKRKKSSSSVMNILLSNSGIEPSDSPVHQTSMDEEICRAELSEDNGFFRIFPTDSGEQNKYLFSVTIVYAKNLRQVISDSLWSKIKGDGLQFKYCLFGCSVFTEPFFNIDDHMLSERGTATVSSSENQLLKYFTQNSFLSLDLISGHMIIANCIVDLDKLQKADYLQQVMIEGAFDLSVSPAFSTHTQNNKATVGVCVDLCRENATNKRDKIYLTKKCSKFSESKYQNHYHKPRNVSKYKDSSSSSSESDSEEELMTRIISRLKSGKSKTKSRKLIHAMKKEKRNYLEEAALEIENWKEEQKQTFLKKWSAREETLQKHLASEWNTKVKIFEGIVEQRLAGCSQLQDKLSESLDKLSIQEKNLQDKEIKVNKMEKEMRAELSKVKNNYGEAMQKSAVVDNKKIDILENEVKKLKEHTRSAENTSKEQMKEIFALRRKMLEGDDTRILKKENERLSQQLVLTEEKKQYYKHQWTACIADMHSAKLNNSDLQIDNAVPGCREVSNLGIKIRHLIEERKALTESGLYPHSHSMVREIDKKIKSLINSTENL